MTDEQPTAKLYQVKDWASNFEGSRSKDYNNKTSCQMPTKHGLGYRKLIRTKNGPALFGAWCAMIQVLSRQPKPRQGYCGDTTVTVDGQRASDVVPYTPEDLECLTDIPAAIFAEMLSLCSSQAVGWLDVTDVLSPHCHRTDSTVTPQCPLDSDSDSDIDSPPAPTGGKRRKGFKSWDRDKLTEEATRANHDNLLTDAEMADFVAYWCEPTSSGKPRFTTQKAWDTRRRMQTALRVVYGAQRERGGWQSKPKKPTMTFDEAIAAEYAK